MRALLRRLILSVAVVLVAASCLAQAQASGAELALAVARKIGAVTSAGVRAHEADKAIDTGIDGTGVMVCVISDGIDSLPARQAAGDLPPVATFGQLGPGDRGTAMLEIVHDVAPGALLAFASGISEIQMANVIDGMRPNGCHIIVDDVVLPGESTYQEGPIAVAIAAFTAVGGTYFSAASDQGNAALGTSGTWEGDFADSGMQSAMVNASEGQPVKLHRFGSLPYNTLLSSPRVLALKWSDPLGASANDYDLFVLDASGATILASSTTRQTGSQDPLEIISCTPSTCPAGAVAVVALRSGAPRALRLQAFGASASPKLATTTSGNTFGHGAGPNVITVGAVGVANASGGSFTGGTNVHVENYSADGLRHLFFNLGGSAITPGNLLFGTGGGIALAKVDIVAADGVRTATTAYDPFFGTSAAAAHAAAIAALVKSADRSATPAVIRSALLASALDIEAPGGDRNSGAGIVMASSAVRAVLKPLAVSRSFAAPQMPPGGASTLTIAITNNNSTRLKGISFTDTYPAAIFNAANPAAQFGGPGCAATLSATPGGGSLSVSGGSVPAFGTCTITVQVTGNVPNAYVDASGTVSTPLGLNTQPPIAMLTIAAAVQAPALQSAVSRRVHGASGAFDLSLSLTPANPTTEPRQGPAASIVFRFDKPITAASVAIAEGTATVGATAFNGNEVIVNLSGVIDAQYVRISLTGVKSTDGGSGSGSVRIGFLAGDVNGSRSVTLSDFLAVNASLAQFANSVNYLRDVNANGSLSAADLLLVNAQLARALPAP